jgi:hypothetical protein
MRCSMLYYRPDLYDVGGGSGSGAVSYCVSTANSTGAAAVISHGGSLSVTANDLHLYCGPMPAFQYGLFIFGANQAQVSFGNGTRCIGAPISRFFVQQASFFGDMSQTIDVSAAPVHGAFTAGSVWNFQAWFRDPPAGGSNFDLSNGLSLTFSV